MFGTGIEVIALLAFVVILAVVIEAIRHQYVYKHSEYKELVDKTKNLGGKIKVLKE